MSKIKELGKLYNNIIQDAKRLYGKAKPHTLVYLIVLVIFIIALLSVIVIQHSQISRIDHTNIKVKQENQDRATLVLILDGFEIKTLEFLVSNRDNIILGLLFCILGILGSAQVDKRRNDPVRRAKHFAIAAEQLEAIDEDGNPAIEIRLGGIDALERIANESKKYYLPIMEILTAYVRKNSSTYETHIAIDIQAILTVLGRCKNSSDENSLNLRDIFLSEANLKEA